MSKKIKKFLQIPEQTKKSNDGAKSLGDVPDSVSDLTATVTGHFQSLDLLI
jgi:hypothetical protein